MKQPIRDTLPHYLNSFVGRQEDIAEITSVLADENCRLLTLLGPGGIGKSRLATEAMPHLQEHFFDGVFFVDLTSVDSPIPFF